jgi:hypothetical protein
MTSSMDATTTLAVRPDDINLYKCIEGKWKIVAFLSPMSFRSVVKVALELQNRECMSMRKGSLSNPDISVSIRQGITRRCRNDVALAE